MIFCQLGYKNFHKGNTSLDDWNKMVNDNYAYCKNFNLWKWAVFYFWIFRGRVIYTDVPSFHPYIHSLVRKDAKKKIKMYKKLCKEYERNPTAFPRHKMPMLDGANKKIKVLEQKLKR